MSTGKKILVGLFVFAFVGGGIAHFTNAEFYYALTNYIIPPGNMALEANLIYLSGALEILAGLLFAIPTTRYWGATLILLLLVAFVPIHVAMCFSSIPHPAWYLVWPRLLFQFVLIYWIAQFRMTK